jgi:hypothetical protein
MRKANLFMAFLFGTVMAAGGALPGQQKPYPVVTTVKDGVKEIMNPEYPRDGRFVGKLISEMTWGEEAPPDAALLNKPIEMHVDDLGRVYVLDWGDMHVKVYEPDGRFLRTIGRNGQGPGEFTTPAFMALMTDGRICLLDGGQHRVSFLSNEGQYLSSFPFEGYFRSLAIDGQDRIFLAKWGAAEEPKLSTEFREVPYVTSIFRTVISGKDMVHLADFLGENMVMKAMGGGTVGTYGIFNIAWGVNRLGRLFGGYNEFYRLGACGPDGKPEFYFGREFEPLKNPRFSGQVGQKKTMPAFGRTIVFDDEDNLWLELSKADEKKPTVYDVFSSDGIYLKQITLDQRIAKFRNGRAYAIVRSESEDVSIRRFRLELTPEK